EPRCRWGRLEGAEEFLLTAKVAQEPGEFDGRRCAEVFKECGRRHRSQLEYLRGQCRRLLPPAVSEHQDAPESEHRRENLGVLGQLRAFESDLAVRQRTV